MSSQTAASPQKAIKHVGVIGAGLMGHGIAQIFLAGGYHVSLFDPQTEVLNQAKSAIREIFGLLKQDVSLMQNLRLASSLADVAKQADLMIEAGPEKLDIKRRIFTEACEHCASDTILATNTSAIPISQIAEGLPFPERIIGMHFWNPPHLVRLVEVIQTEVTQASCIDTVMSLLAKIAMKPVHVKSDIPGFIGNRLQHAMKREAIALVQNGVCDAQTIDDVVKYGFGARLSVLGPLEQSDLVGLNLTLDIYTTLFPSLDNTAVPPDLLKEKVQKGELGMKTGKGFREWTPESAEAVKQRLRDKLVSVALQQLGELEG